MRQALNAQSNLELEYRFFSKNDEFFNFCLSRTLDSLQDCQAVLIELLFFHLNQIL